MKTPNPAVITLVEHLLKKHGITSVTAENLLRFNRMKSGASTMFTTTIAVIVAWVATNIALNMLVGRYNRTWLTDLIPGLFLLAIPVCGIVTVVRFFRAGALETLEMYEAWKLLRASRRKFKKFFGRDILSFKDREEILLPLHVQTCLVEITKKVVEFEAAKKFREMGEAKNTQRSMWDNGAEFVNVPSYEEMYRLAGKGKVWTN